MDWIVSRVDGSRYRQEILELRKAVFSRENPEKQNPEYWDWEFKNAFFGPAEIYAARHGDRLVGHYALLPQRYRIDGHSCTAGLAVDAMVHPGQRRKGMFSVLQEQAIGSTGFTFAMGYTIRKEVLPAELKGGYQIVRNVPVFVFPARFSAILNRYIKPGSWLDAAASLGGRFHRARFPEPSSDGRIVFRQVDSLADVLGDFFKPQDKSSGICLEKSAEYIRWRFDRIPGVVYQKIVAMNQSGSPAGYLVMRRENLFGLDTLAVVDLETVEGNSETTDALVRFVVSRTRELGCDCSAVFLLDDGQTTRRFKKRGFIKSPYRFHLIVHNCGRGDTAERFRRSKGIYLNWSDTDML